MATEEMIFSSTLEEGGHFFLVLSLSLIVAWLLGVTICSSYSYSNLGHLMLLESVSERSPQLFLRMCRKRTNFVDAIFRG